MARSPVLRADSKTLLALSLLVFGPRGPPARTVDAEGIPSGWHALFSASQGPVLVSHPDGYEPVGQPVTRSEEVRARWLGQRRDP